MKYGAEGSSSMALMDPPLRSRFKGRAICRRWRGRPEASLGLPLASLGGTSPKSKDVILGLADPQ